MKTTQKRNILFLTGVLAMMLVFGSVLAGCKDDSSDSGGGGSGGGVVVKPSVLADNATEAQALAKLDQIIAYPGTPAETKSQAQTTKNLWSDTFGAGWSSSSIYRSTAISHINDMIAQIP
ncbi:MAG: hypothetical protein Ta2B_01100 [Termitinemataceae bacterium]|nr:MAG: hypothetical protein Ta2B_01100 [Termitinemataceae bacterium]